MQRRTGSVRTTGPSPVPGVRASPSRGRAAVGDRLRGGAVARQSPARNPERHAAGWDLKVGAGAPRRPPAARGAVSLAQAANAAPLSILHTGCRNAKTPRHLTGRQRVAGPQPGTEDQYVCLQARQRREAAGQALDRLPKPSLGCDAAARAIAAGLRGGGMGGGGAVR